MTRLQRELSAPNVYQLRPQANPNTPAEVLIFPAVQGPSAHDALYVALRPPITPVALHDRVSEIAAVQRRIRINETLQLIASRPDCDEATRDEALGVYRINQSFLDSTLDEKTRYHVTPALVADGYNADYMDYRNTTVMSAALLDEQMPEGNTMRDAVEAVDAGLITTVCEQRVAFVNAHAETSLNKKGQAFALLLASLSETQALLDARQDLPIASAATHVLTGKALHDLALLGEFGKEDRNLAIQAAIEELTSAATHIGTTGYNPVVDGIQKDIALFLKQYTAEVDDANKAEITPAELPALIQHLGQLSLASAA